MHSASRKLVFRPIIWGALFLMASQAWAGPVFIRSGKTQGQGWSFYAARECRVITAAHVVDTAQTQPVLLVGPNGNAFSAKVTAMDQEADLALLTLVERDTSERVIVDPHTNFCSGVRRSKLFDVMPLARGGLSGVAWIERVGSPAGGLEKLLVLDPVAAEDDAIRVTLDAGETLGRGDSGAMVRFLAYTFDGTYSSARKQKTVTLRLQDKDSWGIGGDHLGIAVSVGESGVRVVPAETVRKFIIDSLQPADNGVYAIPLKNDGVVITKAQRGPFIPMGDILHRARGDLVAMNAHNLISMELDLGDGDSFIKGIDVSYHELPELDRDNLSVWPAVFIQLELGMDRPEDSPDFEKVDCKGPSIYQQRKLTVSDGVHVASCRLGSSRISRSARVSVAGNPDTIAAVEVVMQ